MKMKQQSESPSDAEYCSASLDTPQTNVALSVIMDRDGYLDDDNAPPELVALCRLLEIDRNKLKARERRCPTMQEAEARALLRALQEIADLTGMLPTASPAQIVERVRFISQNANARLIAAAPTMLEALRGVIAAWGGHMSDDGCGCADCEYLRPVEDAIREALGRNDKIHP